MSRVARFAIAGMVMACTIAPGSAAFADNAVGDWGDQVRDRVCVEEHGHGVINCTETLGWYEDLINNGPENVLMKVYEVTSPVMSRAEQEVRRAEAWAEYAQCWILDPENPNCVRP